MIKINGRRIKKMMMPNGNPARTLLLGGRQVWPCRKAYSLNRVFPTVVRMSEDADGIWMDVGFQAEGLSGNAAGGWVDTRGYIDLQISRSDDLATWHFGQFVDAPDSGDDLGGGLIQYWARCVTPRLWKNVLVDLVLTSSRYAKSITAMSVRGVPVSLPNFPYAMPADAATLETDLQATGFPDAVVTTSTQSLTCAIFNHTVNGKYPIIATVVSGAVTAATIHGVTITLPSFPYDLATEAADLQADLRTEGYSGAVVNVFGDEWTIALPDEICGADDRTVLLTLDPGDPYMFWNNLVDYQGENPADEAAGGFTNLRDIYGDPLLEHPYRNFARLNLTRGTRTLP